MRAPVEDQEWKSLIGTREALLPGTHFFVQYRITPAGGLTLEEAAVRTLIVTTLRTMRRLTYETPEMRRAEAGMVTAVNASGYVELALPLKLCSAREGLGQLLLLLASGAEYNYTSTFWVESIELPEAFVQRYRGPRLGIQGIREQMDVYGRPLLGLVIKPRSGVPIDSLVTACREALLGGVDFLIDDLLMVDPDGELAFKHRVKYFVDLVRTVRRKDRHLGRKGYFVNVAVGGRRASEYAELAIRSGVSGIVGNAFTTGLGVFEELVEAADARVPVVTTNMGSGVATRGSLLGPSSIFPTGFSESVIAKLCRVAGADAVHTGTSASECYGEDAWGPATRSLTQPLYGIKPSMAVAEGDLTVANLWENIQSLGEDVLLEPTSGIINYPGGPKRGATAFRKLLGALRKEMTPEEAQTAIRSVAASNRVVADGLEAFGYNR